MSGKRSRDKGGRTEREFAKLIGGHRVLLSGAAGGAFSGDVRGLGMLWECKARRDGFKMLYKRLEVVDVLELDAGNGCPLVAMTLEHFMSGAAEIKRKLWKQPGGFTVLRRWLDGTCDALAIKADRKEWLVVMPLETYLQKIGYKEGGE